MSVSSKMTAIADKIRSLLGITGTMGLDAMANNLGTVQTNVTNAFTAIGNKGGTVPSSKVSGNLATAIYSIPAGVTVKVTRGSYTSTYNGATVDCGFKPDLVVITDNEISNWDNIRYSHSVAFLFSETTECDYLNSLMYSSDTNTGEFTWVADIWARQTDNGFFSAHNFIQLGTMASDSSPFEFDYVAIKFT